MSQFPQPKEMLCHHCVGLAERPPVATGRCCPSCGSRIYVHPDGTTTVEVSGCDPQDVLMVTRQLAADLTATRSASTQPVPRQESKGNLATLNDLNGQVIGHVVQAGRIGQVTMHTCSTHATAQGPSSAFEEDT